MPGPCVVLAAAGPAAEPSAKAFSERLLAALERTGDGPSATFDLDASVQHGAAAEMIEREWPASGWVMVRGLGLLAVRQVALAVVWHEGVIPAERYPLLRVMEGALDLELWGGEVTSLADKLAAVLSDRLRGR